MSAASSQLHDVFPIAHVDLVEEFRALRDGPMPHGHVAKSVVHDPDLRVVLVALTRGTRIPSHRASGSMALQVIAGRIIVSMFESSLDLSEGEVLALEPGVEHALVAIEDASLMLTVVNPRSRGA